MTNTNTTNTPPILINNPLTLLYWLFFRPLTLRRYAQSIHEGLDERLKVWQVREEVEHDVRFKVLCRARWCLLATVPLCAVLLWGGIGSVFGLGFEWLGALFIAIGYTIGSLLGDMFRSRFPKYIPISIALSMILGVTLAVILGVTLAVILGVVFGVERRVAFALTAGMAGAVVTGVGLSVERGVALGVTAGVATGMVGAVAFSVVTSVAQGVTTSVTQGVAVAVTVAVAVAVAVAVTVAVAQGVTERVASGVVFGVVVGVVLSVAFGVVIDVAFGMAVGIVVAVIFIIAFLRLPFYLFWELPRAFQLSYQARNNPMQAVVLWRKQPLHYDEVIQLPLFGLPKHLFAIAKQDTDACLEALADVGASLRQQWAIPQALSLILFDQLQRATTTALIMRFHETTAWFPLDLFAQDEAQLVRELRSVSKDTWGALESATREAHEQLLRDVVARVQTLRLSLGRDDKAGLRRYAEPLKVWKEVLEAEAVRIAQQREVAGELPMRYEAGAVLERGANGFKGRQDLFAALEGLLINQTQKITPLLLGQPRTGKSSVLKQLPVRLGRQVLPVYLDMERRANSNSNTSLFADLVSAIRKEALQHPEAVSLPPLDEELLAGDPYRVFENWIEEVEKALGEERWLLLALDEFNRIDDAVRNGRLDERIFFLLRSLIQHHPQVVLTLCGTFSLAECDPRWYEALKSVRYVPVSYFKPDEARRVLTSPSPNFPENVYSEAAIQRALAITGGQPFLIQLLGETIINEYNHSRRNLPPNSPKNLPLPASVVDNAIPTVLTGGETFFMSLWQWLLKISNEPEAAADLLIALARQQPITNLGDLALREELLALFCERDLLIEDESGTYCFQVPLVAQWIGKQRRLPRGVV